MQRYSGNRICTPSVSVCVRFPTTTENKVQEKLKFTTLYDPDETQLNTYFKHLNKIY